MRIAARPVWEVYAVIRKSALKQKIATMVMPMLVVAVMPTVVEWVQVHSVVMVNTALSLNSAMTASMMLVVAAMIFVLD